MSKFIDFDPLRGVETRISFHKHGDTGEQQVHYRQDVEPIIDLANIERSQGLADAHAKRQYKWGEEIHLYARIPPVIIMEIRNKFGINLLRMDKNQMKRAFEIINEHYPKLKTTEKTHRLGRNVQVFA